MYVVGQEVSCIIDKVSQNTIENHSKPEKSQLGGENKSNWHQYQDIPNGISQSGFF